MSSQSGMLCNQPPVFYTQHLYFKDEQKARAAHECLLAKEQITFGMHPYLTYDHDRKLFLEILYTADKITSEQHFQLLSILHPDELVVDQ